MTSVQKLALAGALTGALAGVLLKKLRESVRAIERSPPVLQQVRDAKPHVDEPLSSDDLRVAQNAPL